MMAKERFICIRMCNRLLSFYCLLPRGLQCQKSNRWPNLPPPPLPLEKKMGKVGREMVEALKIAFHADVFRGVVQQ